MMIVLCCLMIYSASWTMCGHLEQLKAHHHHYPDYNERSIPQKLRDLHVEYTRNKQPPRLYQKFEEFRWLCDKISGAVSASSYNFSKKTYRGYFPLSVDEIKKDLADDGKTRFRCELHFTDVKNAQNLYLTSGPPSHGSPPLSGCFITINQRVKGYKYLMLVLADYVLYSQERDVIIYDTDQAISLAYPGQPIQPSQPRPQSPVSQPRPQSPASQPKQPIRPTPRQPIQLTPKPPTLPKPPSQPNSPSQPTPPRVPTQQSPPIMSLDPIQVELEFYRIIKGEPEFQIKLDGTRRLN